MNTSTIEDTVYAHTKKEMGKADRVGVLVTVGLWLDQENLDKSPMQKWAGFPKHDWILNGIRPGSFRRALSNFSLSSHKVSM
jgi:hypothetical protein